MRRYWLHSFVAILTYHLAMAGGGMAIASSDTERTHSNARPDKRTTSTDAQDSASTNYPTSSAVKNFQEKILNQLGNQTDPPDLMFEARGFLQNQFGQNPSQEKLEERKTQLEAWLKEWNLDEGHKAAIREVFEAYQTEDPKELLKLLYPDVYASKDSNKPEPLSEDDPRYQAFRKELDKQIEEAGELVDLVSKGLGVSPDDAMALLYQVRKAQGASGDLPDSKLITSLSSRFGVRGKVQLEAMRTDIAQALAKDNEEQKPIYESIHKQLDSYIKARWGKAAQSSNPLIAKYQESVSQWKEEAQKKFTYAVRTLTEAVKLPDGSTGYQLKSHISQEEWDQATETLAGYNPKSIAQFLSSTTNENASESTRNWGAQSAVAYSATGQFKHGDTTDNLLLFGSYKQSDSPLQGLRLASSASPGAFAAADVARAVQTYDQNHDLLSSRTYSPQGENLDSLKVYSVIEKSSGEHSLVEELYVLNSPPPKTTSTPPDFSASTYDDFAVFAEHIWPEDEITPAIRTDYQQLTGKAWPTEKLDSKASDGLFEEMRAAKARTLLERASTVYDQIRKEGYDFGDGREIGSMDIDLEGKPIDPTKIKEVTFNFDDPATPEKDKYTVWAMLSEESSFWEPLVGWDATNKDAKGQPRGNFTCLYCEYSFEELEAEPAEGAKSPGDYVAQEHSSAIGSIGTFGSWLTPTLAKKSDMKRETSTERAPPPTKAADTTQTIQAPPKRTLSGEQRITGTTPNTPKPKCLHCPRSGK